MSLVYHNYEPIAYWSTITGICSSKCVTIYVKVDYRNGLDFLIEFVLFRTALSPSCSTLTERLLNLDFISKERESTFAVCKMMVFRKMR